MDRINKNSLGVKNMIELTDEWRKRCASSHFVPSPYDSKGHDRRHQFTSVHETLCSLPRRLRRLLTRKTRLSLTDIAFMLAMGISLPAAAQTILVNTDVVGVSNNGLCSLIEAINNANGDRVIHSDCPAGSGADTIVLQNGATYTILRSVNSKPGQGLPPLFSEMTIEGNNSTIKVGSVPVDVVFNVTPKGNLTLKDATISGSIGSGTGTYQPHLHNTGMVQLNNVDILLNSDKNSAITNAGSGNMSSSGLDIDVIDGCPYGACYTGHGIVNHGTATFTDTTINNLTSYPYRTAVYNTGNMSVDSMSIDNASFFTGVTGIENSGILDGTNLNIAFSNNYEGFGVPGFINNTNANLQLEKSIISGIRNHGEARLDSVDVGDVSNSGILELTNSSAGTHNYFSSRGDGANLMLNGVTIANSIQPVIDNKAIIKNSTITGANARSCPYGCYFDSYGIRFTGDITITNSTIGGNNYLYGAGGGILFDGNVTLSNSIIVASTDYEYNQGSFYNILVNKGVLNSEYNLFGDSSLTNEEAFHGFSPGPTDLTATSNGTNPAALATIIEIEPYGWQDAQIPKLADNGGPTETVALVDGSPAIDAGGTSCEPTDQRGISRPQGIACDIGAFEVESDAPSVPAIAEAGVATVNHNWTRITVNDMPPNPVVIVGPPTFNGGDPGVARIRQVGPDGFDIRFQEWDYRDGWHTKEQIPYLVIQAGTHEMPDGSVWEVGLFGHSSLQGWASQYFNNRFTYPGVTRLFLTIQTNEDTRAVTARARNVSSYGFEVDFFEQESFTDGHGAETVGYLAIYSPSGSGGVDIDGVSELYELLQPSVNHNWKWVPGKQIMVEEEKSKDTETWHAFEKVDVMLLGDSLFGQIVTSNGGDPAALRQR